MKEMSTYTIHSDPSHGRNTISQSHTYTFFRTLISGLCALTPNMMHNLAHRNTDDIVTINCDEDQYFVTRLIQTRLPVPKCTTIKCNKQMKQSIDTHHYRLNTIKQ
eukprot:890844_1